MKEIEEKILKSQCDRMIIRCYTFQDILSEEERKKKSKKELEVNSHQYDSVVRVSIFSRKYMSFNNLYFKYPNLSYAEDNIFIFEFKLYNPKWILHDRPFYFYRIRSGSAMTMTNEESW